MRNLLTMKELKIVARCFLASACIFALRGQAISPEVKSKIEAKTRQLQIWGSEAAVVAAVRAANAAPPEEAKTMTNEKWKSLTLLDPFVRSFTRNPLAVYLRGKKDEAVTECFVSGADGTKIAFLSKTTFWSHRDKDKHRVPMSGRVWTGPVEMDEST